MIKNNKSILLKKNFFIYTKHLQEHYLLFINVTDMHVLQSVVKLKIWETLFLNNPG